MTFNSLVFLVFAAILLPLYFCLSLRGQNRLLLVASYIFYGWWDYRFLALLAGSTTLDYTLGRAIGRTENPLLRKFYLGCSLFACLGTLCFFKYWNFFSDSAEDLLRSLGMTPDFPTLRVLLPVGISFYTFQSLSYTIDVYKRDLKPEKSFFDFALYLSFFPQLVAGPIERATHLLPQVKQPRTPTLEGAVDGLWLMLLGYVKKVVIADQLAVYANHGFQSATPPLAGWHNWVFVVAFAIQIYGDFAGYTDIARGIARILGFHLILNFRAPYLVTNPAAFWRHWHISLSSWLRDYLYIPLGGNRGGEGRTYRNLMTTMVIGGLWHGAGYAYVIWGIYQGALLCLHRWFTGGKTEPPAESVTVAGRLKRGLFILLFFQLTCLGWLFFRAGSMDPRISQTALIANYFSALTLPGKFEELLPYLCPLFLFGGLALWLQWKHDAMEHFSTWSEWQQAFGACGALALIATFGVFDGGQFIYFQF